MIGSSRPAVLAGFDAQVLGRQAAFAQGGDTGRQCGSTGIAVGPHAEITGAAKEPARMLLGLTTTEVTEEFARLKGIGAGAVAEPYQMEGNPGWIATLADPDGIYFQLMSPMTPS